MGGVVDESTSQCSEDRDNDGRLNEARLEVAGDHLLKLYRDHQEKPQTTEDAARRADTKRPGPQPETRERACHHGDKKNEAEKSGAHQRDEDPPERVEGHAIESDMDEVPVH